MEHIKSLLQNIDTAEFVLVGIGREFAFSEKDFENTTTRLLFDERLEKLELFSFFYHVLRKRWMLENPNEKLMAAYKNLAELCRDKNYYVISLCYDDLIFESGLRENRIVTPCGGFRRLQRMTEHQSEIVSAVETCEIEQEVLRAFDERNFVLLEAVNQKYQGQNLAYNCILCEEYDEEGYLDAWGKYLKWLQGTLNRSVCVLELGVDLQFPSVIRWPFEKVAIYNQKATFYRIHEWLHQLPVELHGRGVSIEENSVNFLGKLFV